MMPKAKQRFKHSVVKFVALQALDDAEQPKRNGASQAAKWAYEALF